MKYKIILTLYKYRLKYLKLMSFLLFNFFVKIQIGLKQKNITFINRPKKSKKKVLLLEPNSYHGEILPGYVKYFKELGYEIDVLVQYEVINENPFCRMDDAINIAVGGELFVKRFLNKSIKENIYDYILLTSSYYSNGKNYFGCYTDYIGIEPPANMLSVNHSLSFIEKCHLEPSSSKVFTLSGFENTNVLNPSYFGNFNNKRKNDDMVYFFSAGRTDKSVKNYELLYKTIRDLRNENITNFKIFVVGRAKDLPKSEHIIFMGRLNFSEMYKCIEKSDYILALLDPKYHKQYLNNTTTGTRQLSMGFNKPCVINEEFAQAYDFNSQNAVVYKADELKEAMKTAILMKQEEYSTMKNNLSFTTQAVYKKSLENLIGALK